MSHTVDDGVCLHGSDSIFIDPRHFGHVLYEFPSTCRVDACDVRLDIYVLMYFTFCSIVIQIWFGVLRTPFRGGFEHQTLISVFSSCGCISSVSIRVLRLHTHQLIEHVVSIQFDWLISPDLIQSAAGSLHDQKHVSCAFKTLK
jgi:hypothetical protein